ncbi:MAG: TonB C-terminal domain-containing protein, partial [Pseudomonadota bacterium]|nr:TonB C-terminal domain-containing protein [Pseudomonadota bacterium]
RKEEEKKKLEEEKRLAEDKRKEEERKKQDEEKRLSDEKRKRDEERVAQERATKEAAERARQQAEAAKRLKDEYIVKIKTKIEQNTYAPEGITGNPRAEFKIVLLPTGEVLSATLVKSSGNPAYDAAVERSIYKSVPLPLPPNNPELFREFRELRLPFTYLRR